MTSGLYSQGRLITDVQIDSAYSKIIRGEQAMEKNVILNQRIKEKDSVIGVQFEIIGIQEKGLSQKDEQNTLLNKVIDNLKEIVDNEKKRCRRKGLFGFLKGAGAGFLLALLLML